MRPKCMIWSKFSYIAMFKIWTKSWTPTSLSVIHKLSTFCSCVGEVQKGLDEYITGSHQITKTNMIYYRRLKTLT